MFNATETANLFYLISRQATDMIIQAIKSHKLPNSVDIGQESG